MEDQELVNYVIKVFLVFKNQLKTPVINIYKRIDHDINANLRCWFNDIKYDFEFRFGKRKKLKFRLNK